MRRTICCWVLGGLVGTGLSVGLSQDQSPTSESRAVRRSESAAASRPGASTQRRGPYSELFGRQAEPQIGEESAFSADSEVAPDAPEPVPERTGTFNLTGRPRRTAPDAPASDVIHAEFEKDPHTQSDSEILQVRGTQFEKAPPPVDRSLLTEPVLIEPISDAAPPQQVAAPEAPVPVASPPQKNLPETARDVPERSFTPEAKSAAQAPTLRVEWDKHGEVAIGKEFTCELVLSNDGTAAARNVEVVAIFPQNVQLIGAEPAPARSSEFLTWELSEVPAGRTERIQITLMPLDTGEIAAQAEVRFSTAASQRFQVAEPKLALKLTGPQQAMLGDSIAPMITISNPGTGIASNVRIAALIPPGLEHARGGQLMMELGALHPGETRTVRLPLAAVGGGTHVVEVQARADGGLAQEAQCHVSVVAPHITAAIEGPSLRYLGRRATYVVHVTNDGSVPTDNVRVMHKVPEGMQFVSGGQGAQFDSSTHLVSWFVGRLEQGQTARLEATFECEQIGEFRHFVRATTDQGSVSDAQIATTVEGTPLLSMSVRDLEDPVEIGVETAYEVQLKNEGSAPAKGVQLCCQLPEGMSLIDVSGPVQHRLEEGMIVCAPLEQLRPGESVVIRFRVKSSTAGNLRFRAQLTSASVEAPLTHEELTKFYGE